MSNLAWAIGGWEWVALMVIGLLLFGRRLPEVGKNLGRGIVEFRKGIKGIEDEIDDASSGKPQVAGAGAGGDQQTLESPSGQSSQSTPQQTVPHQPARPEPAPQQASQGASDSTSQSQASDEDANNPYRN